MSDAKVSFAVPVEARLRMPGGWAAVRVRSLEHMPGALLRVTIAGPYTEPVWTCNHASLKSEDERVEAFVMQVRKRAIGAGMTKYLRQIADGVDAIVRGEGPE